MAADRSDAELPTTSRLLITPTAVNSWMLSDVYWLRMTQLFRLFAFASKLTIDALSSFI